MGARMILASGVDEQQVQEYHRASALLWNVAGFRQHRMTNEERDALYTAARVLKEFADSDSDRPGATR